MQKITDLNIQGASGRMYPFTVYTLGTETFDDVGGIYIFTKEVHNQHGKKEYYLLYVGQTNSLRNRLAVSHEKWPCAVQNGVNCLSILREDNMFSRRAIELDLLSKYSTPCNKGGW